MKVADVPKRRYRQRVRAEAAEENANRMLDAFFALMQTSWYDEVRLDAVAREAGVTAQTVIRRFGGKEGLLKAMVERMSREIQARRSTPPGDLEAAVEAAVLDYETTGDFIMRLLAEEDRFPAVKELVETGRAQHRAWVNRISAPLLEAWPAALRRRRVDGLVVATDLYTWKLVRRDMGRSAKATETLMLRLARGVLHDEQE